MNLSASLFLLFVSATSAAPAGKIGPSRTLANGVVMPRLSLGHPDGGYIFTAGLKTKEPAAKWVMAGVALLTDISG